VNAKKQQRCVGYPVCDGMLVGGPHAEECPCYGTHGPPTLQFTTLELMVALTESVKLQSHYAELLNMHDGGARMQFSGPEEWIERLKKVGTLR
jgi:hypothetical protein